MKLNTGMLWLALLPLGASGQHIINSEWIDMPFGLYNNSWKGESSESGGILTVTGSGADMTSYTSDGGRVLFKPVHGDCDLTAMVQLPISPDLNYEAEAGLMLRESNDRGLRYMAFVRERADAANAGLVRSLARQAPGINPVAVNQTGYTNQWLKMRVIRNGNTFKTYTSTSAVNEVWMLFTQQSVELGENLNAGIFVCAHTSSTAKLMTNDFQELSASAIVNVQTNAANGVDLTWLTDLPYLPTNTCQYAYSVTRTELDGNQTVVATELLTPIYTDNSITEGLYYKYSISARELPYNPQATTQTVHVGTSGTFRHQASEVNLVAGIAAGLTAAYYDTKDSILPYAVSNITSLAAILNPPGGETTDYKTVVDASLYVDETDTYTFFLELDDGAKLSVDGVKIIENWRDGERWTASAPVKLEKGRAHAFRVEYYQAAGGRIFNLRWNRAGDPNTVVDVPVSSFTPVPAGWMTAGIGNVKLNGNAEFDAINNTISITACGSELTNFVDSGRVALSGFDTTMDLTTTLTSLSSSAASPRAGLTVREEVAFNAVGISLLAVGGGANYSLLALARTDKGGLASATEYTTSIPATDPVSLRIVKKTSEYTLYYKSEAATSWSELETFSIPLTGGALCGLISSSGDPDTPATALFSNTTINSDDARFLPTDDTFVRSDNSPHGSDGSLQLKHRGATTTHEALLRFDLSGISSLRNATLRLVISGRNDNVATQDINVRVHHNMEWQEKTLRWNTPPAGLHFPTVFMDSSDPTLVARVPTRFIGEVIEIDVTDEVLESLNGTGDLTFTLSATISIDQTLNLYSKEHSDSAVRPYMVITTDAPYRLTAAGTIQSGEIALAWSRYPGAESYCIYRATSGAGPYTQIASGVTATTYSDSALTPGAPYFYKVAAISAAGESALSEAADARAASGSASQTASEDAHVNGGTEADTTYNNTTLTCKSSYGNHYYHREPYLKFADISGLAHASQVILKVTPSTASGGTVQPSQIPVNFIRMPDNTWSESTVTFNNHPVDYPPPTPQAPTAPASDRVTAFPEQVGVAMYVDVTEIVRKAAVVNADNKLSIGILRLDTQGSFNLGFHSSEATTPSYRPQLFYSAVNRPVLPKPETSGYYPVLDWGEYPNATAYRLYRAQSKDGAYTLLTNTTETAFSDLTTQSGKVYFYTLTAVTNNVETERSLPVAAAVNVAELRYPVADTGVDGNDQYKNFGASTTVNLKWGPTREQLFKFDVRGLENITSARFRINPSPPDSAYTAVNIRLWKGDYGDWSESAVQYNVNYRPFNYTPQQSDMANHLATISVEYKEIDGARMLFAEADVTVAIRDAAQAGMKYLTLVYTGDPATPDGKGMMYTAMREYAGTDKDPVLILSGSTFTPPEGLIAEEVANPLPESGVALRWRPVAGVDHYVVTRTTPAGETTVIVDDLTTSSYTDASSTFRNTGEYTYTVTAVHADGTKATSAVSITMARTMTQPILADTFVRGGDDYTNAIYGAQPFMDLKRDSNGPSAYNREAFIRIGVTNTPPLIKAYLRVVLRSVNTTLDVDVLLMEVPDSGWEEGNATWITMKGSDYSSTLIPAINDPLLLDTLNLQNDGLTAGSEMLFDITSNIQAAKQRGAETFVMHLFNGTPGTTTNYSISSREAANNEVIPYVIYTIPKYPAGATLLILR